MTPDEKRARAVWIRQQAQQIRADVAAAEASLARIPGGQPEKRAEALATIVELLRLAAKIEDGVDELERGLRESPRPRNMSSMYDVTTGSTAVKKGASRARRKHPAMPKIYDANQTITSIAQELRETRARVSSWMADEEPRAIPRRHAEYLRDKYKIPLTAWKRILD